MSPVVKARKGHYRELFEQVRKQGYLKVRVDGEIKELTPQMKVDRYKTHDIEIVIDRLKISKDSSNVKRLEESIQTAMYHGNDTIMVLDRDHEEVRYFSRNLMCPTSGQR